MRSLIKKIPYTSCCFHFLFVGTSFKMTFKPIAKQMIEIFTIYSKYNNYVDGSNPGN
jgi:hypothetical protein